MKEKVMTLFRSILFLVKFKFKFNKWYVIQYISSIKKFIIVNYKIEIFILAHTVII